MHQATYPNILTASSWQCSLDNFEGGLRYPDKKLEHLFINFAKKVSKVYQYFQCATL